MASRHLIDPQLLPLLEAWPTLTLSPEILPVVREARRQMMANEPPVPDSVELSEHHTPARADAPPVRLLVYRKRGGAAGPRPAILHLHGGGYVMGMPEMMRPACAAWAEAFDARVISAAYRLAPETRFPGNVEDAYAALAWAAANADALGIDTGRIALAGESAGGGLAAALALLVRDRGEYAFCHQQLIFPMLDDRTAAREDIPPVFGEFIWTRESNRFGWSALLGAPPGGPDISPYAAAARAESLKGLPPTFIATGALDLFTEENLDYARRLMADGVPTELHVYPGAPHAFMAVEAADVTRAYARDAMAALGRALG